MDRVLKLIAYIINGLHDFISDMARALKIDATDKDLHFWIIGALGILIFLITDAAFKRISKWNISVLSFIYTFTVLLVIVFGLEIEQKITGRGIMEFKDAVYGLWGFIEIFAVYLGLRIIMYQINKRLSKGHKKGRK